MKIAGNDGRGTLMWDKLGEGIHRDLMIGMIQHGKEGPGKVFDSTAGPRALTIVDELRQTGADGSPKRRDYENESRGMKTAVIETMTIPHAFHHDRGAMMRGFMTVAMAGGISDSALAVTGGGTNFLDTFESGGTGRDEQQAALQARWNEALSKFFHQDLSAGKSGLLASAGEHADRADRLSRRYLGQINKVAAPRDPQEYARRVADAALECYEMALAKTALLAMPALEKTAAQRPLV